MEPRTLTAAYKFYCQKELDMAHDALADVRATAEVLVGQIARYKGVDHGEGDQKIENPIKPDVASLSEFTTNKDILDATQRLKYDQNGVVVFNFGKYMGKPAGETLYKDRGYFDWIQNKEFSVQVKQITKELLEDYVKSLKV
jgi:DNA polymerase-3 subunit epsilon